MCECVSGLITWARAAARSACAFSSSACTACEQDQCAKSSRICTGKQENQLKVSFLKDRAPSRAAPAPPAPPIGSASYTNRFSFTHESVWLHIWFIHASLMIQPCTVHTGGSNMKLQRLRHESVQLRMWFIYDSTMYH